MAVSPPTLVGQRFSKLKFCFQLETLGPGRRAVIDTDRSTTQHIEVATDSFPQQQPVRHGIFRPTAANWNTFQSEAAETNGGTAEGAARVGGFSGDRVGKTTIDFSARIAYSLNSFWRLLLQGEYLQFILAIFTLIFWRHWR